MNNPTPSSRIPELLSPAGDWDAMRAAVANGADAVYFGLSKFNARHRAQNFTAEELPQIMSYLRGHNVKGFLTFNTLIFSDELGAAADYISTIASAGVDAVIVQDLGLVRLVRQMAPTLPIHASTQMTLTEPRSLEFVRTLGAERAVLARELSLEEIRNISSASPMQLEVFIHGALCVAYSGQCLTSESIGGRSANRGQCAQACRLPYDLVVDGSVKDLGDKAYLLSPQDLAAYDLVDDLTKLGVACFKIEGRLKSAHYVAAATETYRKAIDGAVSNLKSGISDLNSETPNLKFQISDQQRGDLEQTFSRGFTHGFLSGVNHQRLVTARFPKSRGRRVGTVDSTTPSSVIVQVENRETQLKPGDGVVFDEGHPDQDEQGGRVYSVKPTRNHRLEIEFRRGDINLASLNPGAIVWKTDDPAIRKRLEHTFSRDTVARRISIDAHVIARTNEKLKLTIGGVTVESDAPLQRANKFPITEQVLHEQLERLGDTPFELRNLSAEIVDEPMVPKSVLNDLRRRACAQLIQQRSRPHAIDAMALDRLRSATPTSSEVAATAQLHVLTRTMDQLAAVLEHSNNIASVYCDFEDIRRYKNAVILARASNKPIALATLRIFKQHEEGLLQQILDCEPDALLVRNLGAIGFYREHAPAIPLLGDYSLNVSNELTASLFTDSGMSRLVPSYDLSWTQLSAMIARSDASRFECVIHQHMPMFHMEHCVFAHTLSTGKDYHDCGRPCERHQVDLADRVGLKHPLIPDVGCRNTVFNGQAQSALAYVPRMKEIGIRHFRIELLREKAEDVLQLLSRYQEVLDGRSLPSHAIRSLRVLNQLGVTSGTLSRE